MMSRTRVVVASLLCSAGLLAVACVTDLGDFSVADVNDAGVMVGEQQTSAVRYAGGTLTALPSDPAGGESSAVAIASDGTILGETASGVVLWYPDGTLHVVGKLNGWETHPHAMNDLLTIVGRSRDPSGTFHGWVYADGLFMELPLFAGFSSSDPQDINDQGVIVGNSTNQFGLPAPLKWSAGSLTPSLLPIIAGSCYASAINELGAIVGDCGGRFGGYAVLWSPDATSVALLPRTGEGAGALDINDHGVIVGWVGAFFGPTRRAAAKWSADGTLLQLDSLPTGTDEPGSVAVSINNSGVIVGNRNGRAVRFE